MNKEQQRIKIAEACGWKWDGRFTVLDPKGNRLCNNDGDTGLTWKQACAQNKIPDYLNDLNAMHAAEEVILAQGLQDRWLDMLVEVVAGKNVHWSDYHCFPQVNRAAAKQRAEAFLKTLGLWEDEQ